MKQQYITKAFKILLAENSMKVTDLCKEANVSRSAIYKTFGEKGTPRIDNETMRKSLSVLGTTFIGFMVKVEKLEGNV